MIMELRQFATTAMFAAVIAVCSGAVANSQASNPFAPGWTIDTEASEIRVLSIKKQVIAESSRFATFGGGIASDGSATVKVLLDSIDTKIDLRNVRMRFLFFETFKYPEAVIETRLTPSMVAGLQPGQRRAVDLNYSIDLHGVRAERTDRIMVTLLDQNRVAVATTNPIILAVSDFGLAEGLQKLQEAANVTIVPIATLSFDFVFLRDGVATAAASETVTSQISSSGTPSVTPVALETTGNFDAAACVGRFEILSRTGNIFFRSGSAELDSESLPLLSNVVDIVRRCPGMKIEVAGHTDSDGDASTNQRLSEARAGAVTAYLIQNGIEYGRISSVGHGESQPAFPNTSTQNKQRNRRIEFTALDG
ncbi:MAG: OmpA family protein [Pseudomonadota bacterium]